LALAAFYAVIDIGQRRAWAFPLIVIGMNSIAAYCMEGLLGDFIRAALLRHLGSAPFTAFGAAYEPAVLGAGVVLVFWLILFWMYRRTIFLRV
jgi:predicted acyltransferase